MTWDYQKFPRHPVAANKFEIRVRNNIILNHHYRFDPELSKGVCDIFRIPCACTYCVAQLDRYWLPTIPPPSQKRYSHVEICSYKKIFEHYNAWIIMKFLDNKTPQVESDNIHALILMVVSTNKAELSQANGYDDISTNDKTAIVFTLFALHMSYIHSNKMWNNTEINWHW